MAFIIALFTIAKAAAREGLDQNLIYDLGLYIALSALVGAKTLLFITEYDYYLQNPGEIFSLETLRAGGVYYGGFILAVLVSLFFTRKHHLSFWKVADIFSPGIALGQAIGRLGCFSAGCCWGKATTVPWAVVFKNPYSHQTVGVPLMIPLHPSQIYEALSSAVIFLILWYALKRKQFNGQIFSFYLALYAIIRFLLEFWRGDEDRGFLFNGLLSTSQFISIILLGLALVLYVSLRGSEHHEEQRR
jgi:phosphatidylglycerol:prolipoprotein diacylglycerol transferase